MIRFHLDEHVGPAIAAGLRLRGFDATTTAEVGLLGADDEQHLEFARREGRVIVTHDCDFLAMASRGEEHPGITYCHQQSRTIGDIVRALVCLVEVYAEDDLRGRVEFL